jgi:hypothetical protein
MPQSENSAAVSGIILIMALSFQQFGCVVWPASMRVIGSPQTSQVPSPMRAGAPWFLSNTSDTATRVSDVSDVLLKKLIAPEPR